jgi:hypothetical protein
LEEEATTRDMNRALRELRAEASGLQEAEMMSDCLQCRAEEANQLIRGLTQGAAWAEDTEASEQQSNTIPTSHQESEEAVTNRRSEVHYLNTEVINMARAVVLVVALAP